MMYKYRNEINNKQVNIIQDVNKNEKQYFMLLKSNKLYEIKLIFTQKDAFNNSHSQWWTKQNSRHAALA